MDAALPQNTLSPLAQRVGLLVDAMHDALRRESGAEAVLVSIAIDHVSGTSDDGAPGQEPPTAEVRIDRQTRTMAFLSATLSDPHAPVLTGSGIYRLER